jgi:serine/threonine protein kinase
VSEPPHTDGLPSEREPSRRENSVPRLEAPAAGAAEGASDADGVEPELSSSELVRLSGTAPIDGGAPQEAVARPQPPPVRRGGAPRDAANPDPRKLFGRLIADRYRIVDLLAEGGMGAVFLAEHVVLKSPVAMKLLQPEARNLPELVERFQREAVVGAHIKHPHIASATDFGALPDGAYYLVLELVEGTTLDSVLKEGPLPPRRAIAITSQIADALSALHERGVVHRDIKPGNVMLLERAGVASRSDFVKVIDFGLARLDPNRLPVNDPDDLEPDERLTSAGVVIGTVAYMSPEAAQGMHAVDERSDLYALGVVLYRMLAGKHPFASRNDVDLFQKHIHEPAPPFAERAPEVSVPPRLEAIALKLLAKDPDERFQTAADLVKALGPLLDSANGDAATASRSAESAERRETPPPERSDSSGSRSRRWRPATLTSAIGGAVAVVAVGVAAVALSVRAAGHDSVSAPPEVAPSAVAAARSAPTASGAAPTASSSATPPAAPVGSVVDPGTPHPVARATFAQAVRDGAWIVAFGEFEKLAKSDVGFFASRHAQRDTERLFAALAHAKVPEAREMTSLLANHLGPAGHDVLLKAVMLRGGSQAHELASEVLARPGVVSHLAPEPAIALRLHRLGCQVSPEVLDEAVRIGDGRALTVLAVQRERCKRDEVRVRAYQALEKRLLAEQAAAAR